MEKPCGYCKTFSGTINTAILVQSLSTLHQFFTFLQYYIDANSGLLHYACYMTIVMVLRLKPMAISTVIPVATRL